MTLKTHAHRSVQALLSNPSRGPNTVVPGTPSLRDPAPSRAQRAESPRSRADFADTLREHSKAGDADARTEPSPKDASERTTASEPDATAPAAERTEEASASPTTDPRGDQQDGPSASAQAGTHTAAAPGDVGDPAQDPAAPPAQVSAAVEIKTQPATIQDLNALLLQGQAPPRFALIAPEHRPGATAKDRTAARTHRESSSIAAERRSDQSPAPGVNVRESFLPARETSARHADPAPVAQSALAPRETPASSVRSESGSPIPSSASAHASPQSPIGRSPATAPTPTAIRPPVAETPATSTSGAAVRASSPHALLDRLNAVSAKSTTPAARPDPNAPALAAQLQRGVSAALNQKSGAVTLRLTPESLGQLKIQVKVRDGALTAAFEVSSTKTREMLTRSLDTLRQGLKDKGLEVAEFKITLAPSLPQRDLGLDPLPHSAPSAHEASTPANLDGQPMTAHDGGTSGHPHHDHPGATSAPGGPIDPAEIAVDLAVHSPDSVADALGRSRYVALPGGRLGLVALA